MKKLQIKEFGKVVDNELHDTVEQCEQSIAFFKKNECFKNYKFKIFVAKPRFIASEKNRENKRWNASAKRMNAMTRA